jgi:hypothetical protein
MDQEGDLCTVILEILLFQSWRERERKGAIRESVFAEQRLKCYEPIIAFLNDPEEY